MIVAVPDSQTPHDPIFYDRLDAFCRGFLLTVDSSMDRALMFAKGFLVLLTQRNN